MKKFYLMIMAVVATASVFAQPCNKLFFSEYVEGGGSRKAVEIYNPTSVPVSLFGYKISTFSNGSTAAGSNFNLNAVIAAGDVYVVASSQADSTFKLLADTVSGGLNFNGNDAVALLYGTDTIDVIGIIGNDPGANGWVVDTANTTNNTLIRKSTVQQGVLHWDTAQWYTLAQDTTRLGFHTGPTNLSPCSVTPQDTLVVFSPTSGTFIGVNGNFNLHTALSLLHTDSMTVDVKLTSGNAAWVNNYTTQTLSFPSGSIQGTLPLTITNDTIGGASHTLTFTLFNATGGLVIGVDSVFTITLDAPAVVAADTCGTLFFSEYVEGSASNKALEIYNPLATTVDLTGYKVQLYSNGSTSPSTNFNLSGTIAAGGVYVIAASQADSLIKLLADTTSGSINFNGNDAVALLYGTDTLDLIGVIGFDPTSSGWTVGTGSTSNHTLVRNAAVKKGNTNWTVAVSQWDSYAIDTFFLGAHTGPINVNACPLTPITGTQNVVGDNIARIYPNPNNGTFVIELKNTSDNADVKLFDLTGRLVYSAKENSNLIHVNMNQINAGMYVVEVKADGLISRTKITVQQ